SRGGTSRSEGGGHRGPTCVRVGETSLVSLLPDQTNQAQTVDATPTLYWYIPPTPASAAEFVLTDDQGEILYLQEIALPEQPGVVKLTLPIEAALVVGSRYRWIFSLMCDESAPSRNTYVSGYIERTTLSSLARTRLRTAEPLEQAQIFAQSNIWHDALDRVAQVRKHRQDAWEGLLASVGLSAIAQEPFQDCCTAK
ncbi:MAG: DUF928 domain-containing protein, partial [Cyanobacteria bacterium P01_A01_bin.17]